MGLSDLVGCAVPCAAMLLVVVADLGDLVFGEDWRIGELLCVVKGVCGILVVPAVNVSGRGYVMLVFVCAALVIRW